MGETTPIVASTTIGSHGVPRCAQPGTLEERAMVVARASGLGISGRFARVEGGS